MVAASVTTARASCSDGVRFGAVPPCRSWLGHNQTKHRYEVCDIVVSVVPGEHHPPLRAVLARQLTDYVA
jgi:hypothetical protein